MNDLFLGRLAFEPKPFTRLDPVALHENGCWRTYSDWTKALPSEGRVFATSLSGFPMGELLAFEVELNNRPAKGPDQFLLGKYERTRDVLDLRSEGMEAARRQLVEDGVSLPVENRVSIIAAIGNKTCVVLNLSRDPLKGRLVADMAGLDRLPTYRFDDRLFEGQKIGDRWIEIPGVTVGPSTGQVNWCRDVDFLELILKRLRRAMPQGGPGSISRNQIPGLVSYLSRADLLPAAGGDLAPMLERAKHLLADVVANSKALTDLVATLSAFHPVEQRLQSEIVARREAAERDLRVELGAKIREDLRVDMRHLEEDRSKLEAEVSALSSSAARLRDEATECEAVTKRAHKTIVDEITSVLRSFGDFPPEGDPSVEAMAARLGAVLENGTSIQELARPSSPWANPRFKSAPRGDWETIDAAFAAAATHHGYDAEDFLLADVGARAGDIVLLPEEQSAFAEAYSEAIAGGNLTRHVLDPSVLNVEDLWTRPGSGRSTAFSKAWAAARLDPSNFFVVLLDGLHRTPLDLWMPSLIDVLDSSLRPSNLLIFATLGPGFIDESRIWKRLDRSVVAVDPALTSDSTALLGEVMGRKVRGQSFDPTSALLPSKEATLDVVDWAEKLNTHRDRLRLFRLHRSSWPHSSRLDPLQRAWSIASNSTDAPGPAHKRIAAGLAWLHAVLQIKP